MSKLTFGYGDELFGFPPSAPEAREAGRFPVKTGWSDFVPAVDPGYVFRKDHMYRIQRWMNGATQNILIQGETGSGKTTLIEQVCARLNWPLYRLACHGGVEFGELIGRVTLQKDGSTGWSDGPLIAAMRNGGVFLLDEMNFLDPRVAGGLNTVLESSAYVIPETGELVTASSEFRIAATGNALDGVGKGSYRGVQTPNIALLARFTLGIRMPYLNANDEAKMLSAKANGIDPKVAELIAEIAAMSRLSFAEGTLRAPVSPRETIALAQFVRDCSGNLTGDQRLLVQGSALVSCMDATFLYRWEPEQTDSFLQSCRQVVNRLGLEDKISLA